LDFNRCCLLSKRTPFGTGRKHSVEEKEKLGSDRNSPLWMELQKRAKDDPELAEHVDAAKRVTERYRESFQRLADS